MRVGWSGVSRWWRRRSPRLFARSRAPAPRWRSGSTAGGWSTCGAGRPIRQLAALGAVTASCSRTRSPSHSSPCARCCWSSAASWSWTLWCSATGRSSPPAQRCGSCSPTRRAWWLWMPPRRRSCSMTGKQCAAGSPPSRRPGNREPHTGSRHCSTGILVGELVRRIDGRSVGGFLRDEVCAPLGLDFAIGLGPTDQARAVDITGLDEAFREPGAGEPELYRRAIANPPGARDSAVVNSARWRAAEIPAVNGHGTGRGVAGFYAALLEGRVLADKRRLRPPYVSPASGTAPASLVDVSRDVSPFHSTPAATVASRSFSDGLKAPRLAARRAPASGQRVRTSSDGPAAGDRDSLSGARRAAARPARIEVAAGGNQRQSATPRSAGASPPTRPLPRACVPASERRRVWKRDRIYAPYAPSDPLVSTTR